MYCISSKAKKNKQKEPSPLLNGNTTIGLLNVNWAPGSTYTAKILQFANQIYGK